MSDLPTANSPNCTVDGKDSALSEFFNLISGCCFLYLLTQFLSYFITEIFALIFPRVQVEKDLKKEIEKNNNLKDELAELKYKLGQAEGRAGKQ